MCGRFIQLKWEHWTDSKHGENHEDVFVITSQRIKKEVWSLQNFNS